MKPRIYIIDDDPSIRRILSNIIDEYELGFVVGKSGTGIGAIKEIEKLKPELVLVDLLLPDMDGIEIVDKVKEDNPGIQFIMISQVTSKDLVEKAYRKGIEFYITKPINVIEVVSIISKATETYNLKIALSIIESNIKNKSNVLVKNNTREDIRGQAIKIFSDLGILGESGSDDLLRIVEIIALDRSKHGGRIHNYKIVDIFERLSREYMLEGKKSITSKAIEQRVRRLIQSSLHNFASLGLEDYSNIKFEKYSSSLFDFKEVRQEMNYIREKSKYRGKINIKKFIEGILSFIEL